jgi:hypothetical protein
LPVVGSEGQSWESQGMNLNPIPLRRT